MKNRARRRPFALWLLPILLAFLGVSAIISGGMLVAAPDGKLLQMPLSTLERSPFGSFLVPGLLLAVFLGFYPILVAYSLWTRPGWRWPQALNPFRSMHWAWAASLAAGAIVLIWILVEMWMVRPALFLQWFILGWGLSILALTLLPVVRREYRG